MKLMRRKYLSNGILGCTLPQIRLKKIMNLKSMIGKNLINQILQELKKLIIHIKIKIMLSIKNIKAGNLNKVLISIVISIFVFKIITVKAESDMSGTKTDIKILDKISSKNELVSLTNTEELIYKDIAIKSMKCTNSELDDNPEIKAYIQVRDLTKNDNDKVYVFNGWMFSSSPSIAPFDHPVYDIWLANCY